VSIENSYGERREGTLAMTLRHDPGGDRAASTWQKTVAIELPQGTSTIQQFVFEDVFEPGNDIANYSLEAAIR
jgi:hypothetical protein